jgi:hypothetical protein
MDGLIRFHEPEERFEGAPSDANQAAAFERISRSSLSLRFSRRNRESSSRSVLVSPPSPLPASRSACLTHSEIDQDVGPNSFAKDAGVRPERTRSTICRLNSGVYRTALLAIVNSFNPIIEVSTETGQVQQPWEAEIVGHLEEASIILPLISADFIASDYCYGVEMKRAMERHERGDAVVIPVILRPCDWHALPIGRLQAVPRNGKPVSTWINRDEAMTDIVRGIRMQVDRLRGRR